MSELTDTLEKVIQQAALDGALTADAVAQFHSLVVERNALKEANEEWEETDKQHQKDRADLNQMVSETKTQLGDYHTRERELQERERKADKLQVEKECADLRVRDHKEMFSLVFRNSIIRKEVMTPAESHTEATGASHSTFSEKNIVDEKTE
jgi:hypothetical protein